MVGVIWWRSWRDIRADPKGNSMTRITQFLSLLLATAAIAHAQLSWGPAPPQNPGSGGFYFGASENVPAEETWTITLYKNGAYLASETGSDQSLNVTTYTTAGLHTTLAASEVVTNQTLTATVNPDTQSPTTPGTLAATNQSSNAFTLTWTASTDNLGVSTYEVAKDGASLGTGAATNRTISTNLQPLVQYQFKVRAQDLAGNWSAWSSELAVILPDTTAPTAPPSLTAPSYTAASVNLSWTAGSDNIGVVAYDVFRTTNGVTTWVGSTASGTLAFVDLFVRASTAYTYAVRSRDAAGNLSTASSSVSVTTSAAPDQDGDGIPDELEVTFGIQGNSTPPQASSLNLKVHRPQ
jgi:chitodextrinase